MPISSIPISLPDAVCDEGRNAAQTSSIQPTPSNNDRAMPRWQVSSIACAVLSGGTWHNVAVVNISLGGAKIRGKWDRSQAITAVSLTDDGCSATGTVLLVQAEALWLDHARGTAGLRFEVPDRTAAANLLTFLSRHIASGRPA